VSGQAGRESVEEALERLNDLADAFARDLELLNGDSGVFGLKNQVNRDVCIHLHFRVRWLDTKANDFCAVFYPLARLQKDSFLDNREVYANKFSFRSRPPMAFLSGTATRIGMSRLPRSVRGLARRRFKSLP
jgi:hypothetical protein